jgi:hypothetical protein
MEYGRALKFPLDAEGWVAKVVIGAVLGLVPIANLAVYGYALEVIRRVASGDRDELPAWDRFSRYLVRGFAASIAGFLYILPGGIAFGLLAISASSSGGMVALSVLLLLAYLLLVGLVFPAAMIRYALTDEWFTMFDFGWIVGFVTRDVGSYLAVVLAILLITAALGVVAVVTFGIAGIVTSLWTMLAAGHLLGQFALRATVPAQLRPAL